MEGDWKTDLAVEIKSMLNSEHKNNFEDNNTATVFVPVWQDDKILESVPEHGFDMFWQALNNRIEKEYFFDGHLFT